MSKGWMTKEVKKNVDGVLNKETVNTLKNKETFGISYIKITDIIRNKHNFYPIVNIDELAEDIKENGLSHNLVVRPVGNKYEIISGERRFSALTKLYEEGSKKYESIPCKIVEADDVQSMIMLIQANAQSRELTEYIRLKQVELLNMLYAEKKSNNIILSSHVQEEIANALNLSVSQVKKYEAISKASESVQKGFMNKELTFSEASSLSRLSKEGQETAMQIISTSNDKVDIEGVKKQIKQVEQDKKREIKGKEAKEDIAKVEQKFQDKLKDIKDSYTPNVDNITNMNKNILIKAINSEIDKIVKRAEKLLSNISDLTSIDDTILESFAKLENVVVAIKEEIDIVSENQN